MVRLDNGKDFVVADLPGLIEGASSGTGLGFQFLRHVERTRVILHLVDMSGTEGRNPIDDFNKINNELAQYDDNILSRPQIVVATKMDMPDSAKNLEEFKTHLSDIDVNPVKVMPISSVTHSGLKDLIITTSNLLDETPKFPEQQEYDDSVEYDYDESDEKPFEISRDDYGDWILSGNRIEKLFQMTDTTHEQSMLRFARQLRGMGVDDELRKAGAKNGDQVSILDFTFTFMD